MKSKQIKLLRKKLEKANKTGYDKILAGAEKENTNNQITVTNDSNKSVTLSLKSWSPADLKSSKRMPEFLQLFEANMGDQYKESSWGLSLENKQSELSHPKARFLVLLDEEKLAGFCHYRFDYDDDEAPEQVVVYVYELQIKEQYRRLGLGKRVMALVEQLAASVELPKVMLTVFKSNQPALDFYKGIQYEIDETSPSEHGEMNADYEILSKKV